MAPATARPARRAIFDDEHERYRESFRTFLTREVEPNADAWDAAGLVPRELFAQAAAHGFLGMGIPEEYGGPGIDDWRFNAVLAEEAWGMGLGACFTGPALVTDICVPYLLSAATPEQKRRWLPGVASGQVVLAIAMTEPGTGSDLGGVRTRARRDGEHYVLSGQKTFITNGATADLVIVVAKTDPGAGRAGISLLLVESGTVGFLQGRQIDKLGQHASDTAELFFDEARVPVENLLGAEGGGFAQLMDKLVPERLSVAVGALAAAEAAFDLTLDYVRSRTAFGQPIGTFQSSRFAMAEMKTELEVTRAFVDDCVAAHVLGRLGPERAAMAKWWTTELLGRVTDHCLQLHGGYGYTREYPISRYWLDARVMRIVAGTTEIMKEIIGRSLGLSGGDR